jgi:ubiquinone/menaquinone biosynthesis C-methylase UbiE
MTQLNTQNMGDYWYKEGIKHADNHNLKVALVCFQKALKEDMTQAPYWFCFGSIAQNLGLKFESFIAFYNTFKLEPKQPAHISSLAKSTEGLIFNQFDQECKDGMLACLSHPQIRAQSMGRAWYSLLIHDPALNNHGVIFANADDPYLLLGLEKIMMNTPQSENWLKELRGALVAQKDDTLTELAAAIAQSCFLSEYVFSLSDNENKKIEALQKDIETGKHTAISIAQYAMYAPLLTLKNFDDIEKSYATSAISKLILQQITQPKKEIALKDTIQKIGAIEDDTSAEVQAMYEQNPYPRWGSISPSNQTIIDKDLRYLVAGCGTGQSTCGAAQLLPKSKITASDLSLTSMAYAKRKAKDSGLNNISFKQIDILQLNLLDQEFDIIECGGVLHHMKYPLAGWQSLLNVLAAGGRMTIALYSNNARRHIFAGQKLAQEHKLEGNIGDIRKFRDMVFALEESHPAKRLMYELDFYSTSNLRDLVFHVQEKCYDLSEIQDMLNQLGLVCLGLQPHSYAITQLYRQKFPDDPLLSNLSNWAALEKTNPEICVGMYAFFCGRKGEEQSKNASVQKLIKSRIIYQ